jgi:hypothetical protein
VLDGDEFVALLARLDKRHVQAHFEFLGNHGGSFRLAQSVGLTVRLTVRMTFRLTVGQMGAFLTIQAAR